MMRGAGDGRDRGVGIDGKHREATSDEADARGEAVERLMLPSLQLPRSQSAVMEGRGDEQCRGQAAASAQAREVRVSSCRVAVVAMLVLVVVVDDE
ncbi:unnamed protein product [Cutaneotrichosporon oleaginosum]